MLCLGEIKIKNTKEELYNAVLQLGNYVKQVFREQMDRRFIIGFTLCLDNLNVYLFDRSGVLAAQESINIHKV